MPLLDLKVSNVRNLKQVEISPASRINIIYGANASGKTSLLESIYLLSRGKSFRTHHLANIVNSESSTFSVTSRIAQGNGQCTSLGIEHRDGRFRMKAEGTMLKRASDLAGYLPLMVIHQGCHQILSLGPKHRRRFLDWGVFHVEPTFLSVWRRYNRALKQRNAWLQRQNTSQQHGPWDEELEESAERLHSLREQYIQQLSSILHDYAGRLFKTETPLSIDYRRGWKADESLSSALSRSYIKDKTLGYTQSGPHRADLHINVGGKPVQELMSRGQQKLLIYAMHLAQASLYRQLARRPCIILADDANAEIDAVRMGALMNLIEDLGVQAFLTMIEGYRKTGKNGVDLKMFHVEHGQVKEVI